MGEVVTSRAFLNDDRCLSVCRVHLVVLVLGGTNSFASISNGHNKSHRHVGWKLICPDLGRPKLAGCKPIIRVTRETI